jgi:hypothetical protein
MTAKKKQPDGRIDRLTAKLKELNGGMLDGTVLKNRQYCFLLLNKVAKEMKVEGRSEEDIISDIIDAAKADRFHGPKTTSFSYLFYNFVKIYNGAQQQHASQPSGYSEQVAHAVARRLAARKAGG